MKLEKAVRRFQQYFSHITATAHIIYIFPRFHQYKTGALKCFAHGNSHAKKKKKTEDPLRLEPRSFGLRVEHFTTEPGMLIVTLVKL